MRARLAAAGIPDPVIDSIAREHEALRCRFPFGAFAADRAAEAACSSTTERALADELHHSFDEKRAEVAKLGAASQVLIVGSCTDARAFGAVDATSGRVVLPSHLAADLPPSITADTDRALLCSRCGRTERLVADEAVPTCACFSCVFCRQCAATAEPAPPGHQCGPRLARADALLGAMKRRSGDAFPFAHILLDSGHRVPCALISTLSWGHELRTTMPSLLETPDEWLQLLRESALIHARLRLQCRTHGSCAGCERHRRQASARAGFCARRVGLRRANDAPAPSSSALVRDLIG